MLFFHTRTVSEHTSPCPCTRPTRPFLPRPVDARIQQTGPFPLFSRKGTRQYLRRPNAENPRSSSDIKDLDLLLSEHFDTPSRYRPSPRNYKVSLDLLPSDKGFGFIDGAIIGSHTLKVLDGDEYFWNEFVRKFERARRSCHDL